jgi:hypothetical protein
MSLLHGSIPPLHCYVRKEFLHDMQEGEGEFEEVQTFAVISTPDQALNFTVMNVKGAQFTRVPLHALCWREDAPKQDLSQLQRWDCFSYNFSIVSYDFLRNMRCKVFFKDGSSEYGTYLWTMDWYASNEMLDTTFSEIPEAHKTGHFIQLDNGNFTFQPNNFVFWHNSAVISDPYKDGEYPNYKTNTHLWSVENKIGIKDGKARPKMGKPGILSRLFKR